MNVPRIEISPPSASEYEQQKQNQFHPSPSVSPVQMSPQDDHFNYAHSDTGFYPSWHAPQPNTIGRSRADCLAISSPHNSYYSSPDISPMGSRNSSFSELDTIGRLNDYMARPYQSNQGLSGYDHGGHSDSECVTDSNGKKRKVSIRPRSDSCFDTFGGINPQFTLVMPPWIRIYPAKIGQVEMKITRQPTNHRAQYIGEGSRGPMRSQKGYPSVRINGFKGSGHLRLYLATEDDPVKYHPFYQVCKVMTKDKLV